LPSSTDIVRRSCGGQIRVAVWVKSPAAESRTSAAVVTIDWKVPSPLPAASEVFGGRGIGDGGRFTIPIEIPMATDRWLLSNRRTLLGGWKLPSAVPNSTERCR
jgi:hypothetical protein